MSTSSIDILLRALWTAIAFPGLYYALKLFRLAVIDSTEVKKRKINSIREYAAFTSVMLFGGTALTQLIFVLIGVIALIANTPSNSHSPVYVSGLFILGSLIFNAVLFLVERRRQALIKKIKEFENGEGEPK